MWNFVAMPTLTSVDKLLQTVALSDATKKMTSYHTKEKNVYSRAFAMLGNTGHSKI